MALIGLPAFFFCQEVRARNKTMLRFLLESAQHGVIEFHKCFQDFPRLKNCTNYEAPSHESQLAFLFQPFARPNDSQAKSKRPGQNTGTVSLFKHVATLRPGRILRKTKRLPP